MDAAWSLPSQALPSHAQACQTICGMVKAPLASAQNLDWPVRCCSQGTEVAALHQLIPVSKMTTDCSYTIEKDAAIDGLEDTSVAKRDGVLSTVLCRISQFLPIRLTMRAFRGFWLLLGFSPSDDQASAALGEGDATSPARQCLAGRKRLNRVTRILLAILPRRIQRALGYPVCTSIGCSVSPEVRVSPNKPSGKGNKRKQEDLDEDDEDDEEQQTWVEALTQELAVDDVASDPDFEPSALSTDSEEYNDHNDTESDLEISEKGVVVIEDVATDIP
ncbi:hypothetical protein UPYG_G00035180 [Umbra pygmaea]|uniref:Uncharacterized protein n=1 Tax=Umbra pygmaea TaxID=75934 RepID=A0ABD0YAP2_UMBPY